MPNHFIFLLVCPSIVTEALGFPLVNPLAAYSKGAKEVNEICVSSGVHEGGGGPYGAIQEYLDGEASY